MDNSHGNIIIRVQASPHANAYSLCSYAEMWHPLFLTRAIRRVRPFHPQTRDTHDLHPAWQPTWLADGSDSSPPPLERQTTRSRGQACAMLISPAEECSPWLRSGSQQRDVAATEAGHGPGRGMGLGLFVVRLHPPPRRHSHARLRRQSVPLCLCGI